MRFDGNEGRLDNYEPNSFDGPLQDESFAEPPLAIHGNADHYDSSLGNDDYTQAGILYRMFSEEQKELITTVIAGTMQGVPAEIVKPNIENFRKCDPDFGARLVKKVGIGS